MKSECIDIEVFAGYIGGSLTQSERDRVEEHFAVCNKCFEEFVSITALFKDKKLFESHFDIPEYITTFYKWIKETISPGYAMQPADAAIRSSNLSLSETDIRIVRHTHELKIVLHIKKTEDKQFSIHVYVYEGDKKPRNIRVMFTKIGGASVSVPLTGEYALIEDLSFGIYQFDVKQNAEKKDSCLLIIHDQGVEVNDDLS